MHRTALVAALLLLAAPAALARHEDVSVDDRLREVEALLDHAATTGRMDALHEARVQVARARADLRDDATPRAPAMSPAAEAALHEQLRRASYDSSRVALLRGLKNGAAFTTADVAAMLATFGSDSGRVEAVRVLRDAVVDPENRVLLLASFDYDSSRIALLDVWKDVDLTEPTTRLPAGRALRSSRNAPRPTARGS